MVMRDVGKRNINVIIALTNHYIFLEGMRGNIHIPEM
jgi:hypothetical protein